MKKLFLLMASAVIMAVSFQACSSTDQKIRNEVKNVVTDDYSDISSSVKNGVVTLSGTVETQQERAAAETAARSVRNVKSVVNNIQVNNTAYNMDNTMESTLSTRLNNAGYRDVKVDVREGEVVLSGDLDRNDLNRVMQIANESNPRRVVNNMNLR